MSEIEELRSKASQLNHSARLKDSLSKLSEYVPQSFTLEELSQLSTSHPGTHRGQDNARPDLLVVLACLQKGDRICAKSTDSESIGNLTRAIAHWIAPISVSSARGADEDSYEHISEQCREVAHDGLGALQQLLQHTSSKIVLDDEVLITLAGFADGSEPWVAEQTAALANSILTQQLAGDRRELFIVETILKGYLRPLFSKARPTTITESGRKAEYRDHDLERERALPDETGKTKPWKYTDLRAIPAFSWAISHSNGDLISRNWPLFIPVLLTLLDDPATRVRSRGLILATDFLTKLPDQTLQNTGLSSVFEEAIFPTLNFLPNLTPEDESVQLLDPAFTALRVLAGKASADARAKGGNSLRDKILREGVFMAHFHANQHMRIVEVLYRQTAEVVRELGIHAVKHLKDLIPMLSTTITDPFAPSHPPTLLVAIAALQATIANCWPRLSSGIWQDEIIKMLVLGWLHLVDDDDDSTLAAKKGDDGRLDSERERDRDRVQICAQLVRTAEMLAAVAEAGKTPLAEKVAPLLDKEPELAGLFPGMR